MFRKKNSGKCEAETGKGKTPCGKKLYKDYGTCGKPACAKWLYDNPPAEAPSED